MELTVQAVDKGFSTDEIETPFRERSSGTKSKLRTFRDGFRILFSLIILFRDYKPQYFFGTISFIFFLAGLVSGSVPIYDYYTTHLVAHFPLAILAASLMNIAMFTLLAGVSRGDQSKISSRILSNQYQAFSSKIVVNSSQANIDSIYYRDGVKTSASMRVLITARKRMFKLFMEEMKPGPNSRIIDIGVSDEENDGANFLEKYYPWQANITCAGLGDGELVKKAYPAISFTTISPGEPLPFPDTTFDIAYSNAVLEHVGGLQERKAFIKEHLRVAKALFITVPNRWFPVEHHTGIPFLHYSKNLFRSTLAKSRYSEWTDPKMMDFITKRVILNEWPEPIKPKVVLTGIPLGPFSSNLCVVYRK